MSDTAERVFGPAPLNGNAGSTLFTLTRSGASINKFFIRDITLTNTTPTANDIRVRMSIGSISDSSKRIVDQLVSIGTATYLRPLWLLDETETLQGLQIMSTPPTITNRATWSSGTDATAYASTSWTPALNTMYVLYEVNGKDAGTPANPSSISGNGTWTLIDQTFSSVAAVDNVGISAWYFYSTSAGAAGTTTVNFGVTQHSIGGGIFEVSNAWSGSAAVPPWTSTATPIIQSAVAADTVAPGSTASSKTVTFGSTPQTGWVFHACATAGAGVASWTPPVGFTENQDTGVNDITGSIASHEEELSFVTVPPHASTTVGPATASAATTQSRATVAWEMVPGGWVNCMVTGIREH
jgi:hypothetical protein